TATQSKSGTGEVTFPRVLTDQENPTTAMAAVRGARGEETPEEGELPRAFNGPPAASDSLPIVPLPAQDVLDGARQKLAPGGTLRDIAKGLARRHEGGRAAAPR